MGIIFALLALGCWGLGDFLIQRSTRKFGDWIALFYITAFGALVIFPFVYAELPEMFLVGKNFILLIFASVVMLGAALLDFEALRVGKISVIEPINAFELPVTALLAAIIINERLSGAQTILIAVLLVGIFLVSARFLHHFKNLKFERGVWLAVFAMLTMAAADFLFGVSSRQVSALAINWFLDFFLALICLGYLAYRSRLHELARDWKRNKKLILSVSLFDNLAWVAYAFSVLYIPIAIATGISESYIALASVLGLIFNREKLKSHQWIGLIIVVIAVIALAMATPD